MTSGKNNGETVLLEYAAGDCLIQSEADALELVAACVEHGCSKLLIDAACFSEDFYHLRTGLAGAVLQKFANYSIKAAVVASHEATYRGKFEDFMLEANRGSQLRIFKGRNEAIAWLLAV